MRLVPFTAVFVVLSAAGVFALDDLIRDGGAARDWFLIGFGLATAVLIAIVLLLTGEPETATPRTAARPAADPEPEPPSDRRGGPYRRRLQRAGRILVPPISGTSLATIVGMCLAVTAGLVPIALRQPRWIEAEAVFGAWWLVLSVTFAVLLYRGWRVADDHAFSVANPPRLPDVGTTTLHIAGCAPEGCLVIVVAGSAAIAAWVLVELLVPILLFAVYYLLVKAIARIANDRHGCEDKPVRALVWGTAWATLYIAPLVVLTWIVQSVLSSRG